MKQKTAKATKNTTSNHKGVTAVDRHIILDNDLPNGPFKTYCVLAMLAEQGNGETYSGILLDNAIITNKKLSYGAFRLYCIFASLSTNSSIPLFFYTQSLAILMEYSVSSARRYVKELTNAGIIEKVRYEFREGLFDTGFIIHDCIRNTLEA